MFMTLLNGSAWLFVIGVGVVVGAGVAYAVWRMAMEILVAISEIPASWRTRHLRRARARERKTYDRAFRQF